MTERGAFSPAEAGEWLGFDRSTIYRLMKAGQIPYVVIGKSRRIARSALEALVMHGSLTSDEVVADRQ